VAWVVVAGAVGLVALYRARVHYLDGAELRAAVVIGCASVAVSPISWAHHQIWGPLAFVVMMQLTRPPSAAVAAFGASLVFFAFSPTQGLSEEGTLAVILGWELPTLVFVFVSLAGLPRLRSRTGSVK
jgi:alpha-1,2-mannosyltransferase